MRQQGRAMLRVSLLVGLAGVLQAQPFSYFVETVYQGVYSGLPAGATTLWHGAAGTYDDLQDQVAIGFPFTFDGATYTTANVCVNGLLSLGPAGGTCSFANDPMPDPAFPNPVIAGWWDDLMVTNLGTADRILYDVIGRPGQRRFVVEWRSVSQHTDTPVNYSYANFQIHLVEGTNQVELRYGTHGTVGAPADYSATVGAEDRAGTFGFDTLGGSPGLTRADFPDAGTVILYRPPLPVWGYSMTSASAAYPTPGSPIVIWSGATGPHDDESHNLPIGFPFVYDGINYTDVHVCVNGFLTFGSGGPSGDFTNDPIPDPTDPNPIVAGWWDDLCVYNLGVTDQVRYERTGVTGDQHLMIEWLSVSRSGDTAVNNSYVYFQIWLHEADSSITIFYETTGSVGAPVDFSASMGIEGHYGVLGIDGLGGSPGLVHADFPLNMRYDFRSILCGDCNGDGGVTITDALQAAQHAVTILTLTGSGFVACNVSGIPGGPGMPGATVDILDALAIAQFAVGSVPILTC